MLYEFMDSDMWTNLDALLVKIGVKTLLLPTKMQNSNNLGEIFFTTLPTINSLFHSSLVTI